MIVGKKAPAVGVTPSIALINPKYPRNVGQAIRAASCFGIRQVWFTGERVSLDVSKGQRLPREERMKGYSDVELVQFDYVFDQFAGATPVAVEITPNAENLTEFEHPENPLYVFGPEDGSIPKIAMAHCHRFVTIPTKHCVNLAAAVYLMLYDRQLKRQLAGLDPIVPVREVLAEPRGWTGFEDAVGEDYRTGRQELSDILK
jgi:tRNA(Leu) C34 or U34 (ribose-2'-O)-methylase TrmL